MASANATELFLEMDSRISDGYTRQTDDGAQPAETREAWPGQSFTLRFPQANVVGCREVDRKWAGANVLHFFANTEEAGVLRQYNRFADKFLTGDKWLGAYGAIAVPQLRKCVEKLTKHPNTRRAIVDMGGLEHDDINRPACWSFIQFLRTPHGLNMIVFQRSLNLYGVMPYDCILLTNIHNYVATLTSQTMGLFTWIFGSLHTIGELKPYHGQRNESMLYPVHTLADENECRRLLLENTGS